MGEIGNQLGQLLVQSIPTIVFVLFLVAFLNRLFFKPLSQTLEARAKATSGALAEAREQAERADARMAEYDKAIQAARQEIYQHREAARREALEGHMKSGTEDALPRAGHRRICPPAMAWGGKLFSTCPIYKGVVSHGRTHSIQGCAYSQKPARRQIANKASSRE